MLLRQVQQHLCYAADFAPQRRPRPLHFRGLRPSAKALRPRQHPELSVPDCGRPGLKHTCGACCGGWVKRFFCSQISRKHLVCWAHGSVGDEKMFKMWTRPLVALTLIIPCTIRCGRRKPNSGDGKGRRTQVCELQQGKPEGSCAQHLKDNV